MTPEIQIRLTLAAERLSELREQADAYLAYARTRGSGEMVPWTSLAQITVHPLAEPSPRLAALAGEVLYHLRSALDFAVYTAAFLDSGAPQRDTQFPFVSDEQNWHGEAAHRLKGLAGWRREVVRTLQPFCGNEWGNVLRKLSNPDKHRHLTVYAVEAEHKLTVRRMEDGFESAFESAVVLRLKEGELIPLLDDLAAHVTAAIARLLVKEPHADSPTAEQQA